MPGDEPLDWTGSRWTRRGLWLAAALAIAQAVGVASWYWPGSMPDTDTSGVWTALADDAAHGDFYRPLQGPLGTGGTRYMPLFFSLHAGLIKLGCSPLASGVALTLGSMLAFAGALGALLRQLKVPASIAWPAAVVMFGTVSFGMMSLTVRGDFLAAAFNLAGVTVALGWRERGGTGRLWLAAALFAAAFLTKLTTIFGLAAVVVVMVGQAERRSALQLALASAGLMAVGVMLAQGASDGRMLMGFRAVAHGGGDAAFALRAPLRLLVECARDPLFCLLLGAAALGIGGAGRLVQALVAACLAVTLVIFASPGTNSNHLLDLEALVVVVLVVTLARPGRARGLAGLAFGLFGLGIVATWLPGVPSIPAFFKQHGRPPAAAPAEFAVRAGGAARPILAENPLIPLMAGERPVVADLFNLELMMRGDPVLRASLIARLSNGEFGAVVVSNWPGVFPRDVDSPDDPLIAVHGPQLKQSGRLFGEEYETLLPRYRIVLVRRPYVYFLRNDLPFAPLPP